MRVRDGLSLCSVFLFSLCMVSGLQAFQLVPMSAVIDLTAGTPATSFELTNSGSEAAAIELRVSTRRIDQRGTEFNDDASHLFQVFPSQIILRPGISQTVRVRWIGEAAPGQEQAFRLVAEQLPVRLGRDAQEGSGVQFMLRYRASLYVRPPGTAPEVRVVSLSKDPEEGTELLLKNEGTRHQLFSRGSVIVTGAAGREETLRIEDLPAFQGVNLLPGASRLVRVPRDQFPFEPRDVSFLFE
ncbi:fimbrial chaperone protein [Alkalispirochaeta americana]|uniref:Fimbrial chaperone protein n=1 Tax=Alkalispirochaeta americana TaxID=159291 RepID=A0A1N6SBY7_9SPIO|nr:fimbria/pilus periplasmic chaperone [Alkalispirochaeta americana]SIQ38665.1 fimbrial chaperone protein [Alkalispirochaeta americana]